MSFVPAPNPFTISVKTPYQQGVPDPNRDSFGVRVRYLVVVGYGLVTSQYPLYTQVWEPMVIDKDGQLVALRGQLAEGERIIT